MSSRSHPHTVSQEPFRKDVFRWGSGSCVGVFWRFGGMILSLDGKPGDTDKKKIRPGVGEEKGVICCSHRNVSRLGAVHIYQILLPSSRSSLNAAGLAQGRLSSAFEVS